MVSAIVAVSPDWGIGDGKGMLYRLPGDLKYFRRVTLGHPVVMGRKTLESFPGGRPLPGRENIVITRNRNFHPEGVTVLHSLAALRRLLAARSDETFFVIGGGEIYEKLLPDCETAYVTMVETAPPMHPTVFFPDLSKKRSWEMISASEPQTDENGAVNRSPEWQNKKTARYI